MWLNARAPFGTSCQKIQKSSCMSSQRFEAKVLGPYKSCWCQSIVKRTSHFHDYDQKTTTHHNHKLITLRQDVSESDMNLKFMPDCNIKLTSSIYSKRFILSLNLRLKKFELKLTFEFNLNWIFTLNLTSKANWKAFVPPDGMLKLRSTRHHLAQCGPCTCSPTKVWWLCTICENAVPTLMCLEAHESHRTSNSIRPPPEDLSWQWTQKMRRKKNFILSVHARANLVSRVIPCMW